MDISGSNYKIVFTNDSINEMNFIYKYISEKLFANTSAIKLMNEIEKEVQNLKFMPKKYKVIKRFPELNMEYRRLVIKNYVIIYTISEKDNKIYIVHMFYGGSNYLDNL